MKKSILAVAGLAIATTGFSAAADAGPFSKLRDKVKKVEKKVEEVEEAVEDVEEVVDAVDSVSRGNGPRAVRAPGGRNAAIRQGMRQRSNYPKTARPKSHAGIAGPMPAKFKSATQCANVGLSNAFIAQAGDYTFSQGISTEERSGLLNRVNVTPTNGCVFPAMGVFDVLYVEVDKVAYNKGRYALQCVSYDGKLQLDNVNAPPQDNYSGKDVMLHTGNSTGYTPTATGSNSSRSNQYKKVLDARGKKMITFNMPGLHTDRGTDFYCQHYDKNTGKSTLAFTFRRGPTGS
ncbi:hypothetical protein QWY75_08140 [Pontixanthobacter aestiaquae]|uniref:Uncharacterized protein n=1 Tax=Pontixanthobacter aestiaquae TaxID=1509367 RepID=A0A844Z5R2_9SPHN|nr:hypothetical protein [Pontixanthobacter aestiaquae]MDN3646174.1 hypothetical protein [Pontixanthobacter aestiaquae]MXO82834.1 hypothetical protein [Pontixanthobacter aestiaquae]